MMRLQAHVRSQAGFTVIEALLAGVLGAIIIGAAAALFVNNNDHALSAQRQSELIAVADQQIENLRGQVKAKGFAALAMSGQPQALPSSIANTASSATSPVDPNTFVATVTGCGGSGGQELMIQANFDDTTEGVPVNPQSTSKSGVLPWSNCTSTTSQVGEPLEILSGGFVTPQQNNVSVGSDTATVDTYVTDTYVGCNSGSLGGCPTTTGGIVGCNSSSSWPTSTSASTACADARRVVVAVVLNDHGRRNIGQNTPVYVSTIFTNPVPSNAPQNSIGLTLGGTIG
jgi:type II secretory pathway pseudopilin PulG